LTPAEHFSDSGHKSTRRLGYGAFNVRMPLASASFFKSNAVDFRAKKSGFKTCVIVVLNKDDNAGTGTE